jgi:hypothetical protein
MNIKFFKESMVLNGKDNYYDRQAIVLQNNIPSPL